MGTLAYMAPEQANGEEVAEPADVYSLALTLYECWAGRNPVARDTPARTAREIGNTLPSLRDYRPDLPEALLLEIDACLDPRPELRPSIGSLRECLEHVVAALDANHSVPSASAEEPHDPARLVVRALELGALLAWGFGLALLASTGHRDAAYLAGVLSAPIALAFLGPGGVALPALAGALPLLVVAGPEALPGPVAFAVASLAFGPVLRFGHVALALLGVLLWSATTEAALRLTLDTPAAPRPLLIVGAALAAVAVEHRWRRGPLPAPRRALLAHG
jgi:hypothetical protein